MPDRCRIRGSPEQVAFRADRDRRRDGGDRPGRRLSWGEVSSDYDPRGGSSGIRIAYYVLMPTI